MQPNMHVRVAITRRFLIAVVDRPLMSIAHEPRLNAYGARASSSYVDLVKLLSIVRLAQQEIASLKRKKENRPFA